MRPFIIHSLPRSGTRMLCGMLQSHPDIHEVIHEHWGTEAEWRAAGGCLMQYQHVPDWAWDVDATRIHFTRDYHDGALSQLLMSYHALPNGTFDVPQFVVDELAEQRQALDKQLRERVAFDFCLSYEQITGGKNAKYMPRHLRAELLAAIGVRDHALKTGVAKRTKVPRSFT